MACPSLKTAQALQNTKANMAEILIDPSAERRILDFRPLGFRDVVVLGRPLSAEFRRRRENTEYESARREPGGGASV